MTRPSFVPVWNAAVQAFGELGAAAFFVVGVAGPLLGDWTPIVVLTACALGAFVRALDVEQWALFIPGGVVGRARLALGLPGARTAAATVLAERLLFAALACVVLAHYASGLAAEAISTWRPSTRVTAEELSTLLAVALVGTIWIRARLGLDLRPELVARASWIAVAVLLATVTWASIAVLRGPRALALVALPQSPIGLVPLFVGLALASVVFGAGDGLARQAHAFAPPRVQPLRRAAVLVAALSFALIALPTFLFSAMVPAAAAPTWMGAPLLALAQHADGPPWLKTVGALALIGVALGALFPAARAALMDAEHTVRGLSADRVLPEALAQPHPRFGTMTRAIDLSATAAILAIVTSGGQTLWLGRAYAMSAALVLLVRVATLVKFRILRPGERPFKAPFNVRVRNREIPLGLLTLGATVLATAIAMLVSGDVAAMAAAGLAGGLVITFMVMGRQVASATDGAPDPFELLGPAELALGHVEARPDNVLVPVRNPHVLEHVIAALRVAGD